jgi:hypothetical protein
LNPSRPAQFEVHWLATPGQVTAGWTNRLCTDLNFFAEVAA